MVSASEGRPPQPTSNQMTNINNTAVAKESGLKQVATAVAIALSPFAVVLGIAAIFVTAADTYSNAPTCSTDFGGNVVCRTAW